VQHNRDGGQKLYKLFGLFSLSVFLLGASVSAQSFKDFKKTQAKSFTNFKDKRDTAFSAYIKKQFQEYRGELSKQLFEKPKPPKIDATSPKSIKAQGPYAHIIIKTEDENVTVKKSVEPTSENYDISFNFFGSRVGFDIPKSANEAKYYPQNQKGIASFFDVVASSQYAPLLHSIKNYKEEFLLNDWGVYLLVTTLGEKMFTNPDEAKLLSWFVFNKLGYDVKVGLTHKHIVLMHYSKKIIYSTPNYTFGTKKFYVVSEYAKGRVGSIYSYKQSYPNATKALDLSLKVLPNFVKNIKTKMLTYKTEKKTYSVTNCYNQNLIDFMATYPQADYGTFFNAALEDITYESIAKDLKKYIDGKKASVAMNFVLNFVQNAFVYQVDEKQFGREKVMFAQETLYYAKSDCEDRAILFAYLIKKLFHIGVIGVKYTDHMTTALYIPINGDSVVDGRKKYIIADPTYINANIGMSMPKYRSVRPESFIKVKG